MLNDKLIDRGIIGKDNLKERFFVFFGTNQSETSRLSDLTIPITTAAEHAASYINVDGRIQRTFPAMETTYTNRRLNLEMSEGRLDRYGTSFDNWVNAGNKIDCMPLWDSLTSLGERLGLDFEHRSGRAIMEEISNAIPALDGVSYDRMDEESGIPLADKKKVKTN